MLSKELKCSPRLVTEFFLEFFSLDWTANAHTSVSFLEASLVDIWTETRDSKIYENKIYEIMENHRRDKYVTYM